MEKQVQRKLVELVASYGEDLISNPQRVKALLLDCCAEHRLEINLIWLAQEQGIPQQLEAEGSLPSTEMLITKLTSRLRDALGLSGRAARWAVVAWALALGLKIDDASLQDDTGEAEGKHRLAGQPRSEAKRIRSAVQKAVIGEEKDWGTYSRYFAISPDGSRIAVRLANDYSWKTDNVFVYDLYGRLISSFRHFHGGEEGVAFWRDGNHLLTPGSDPAGGNKDGLVCWCVGHRRDFQTVLADTPLTDIRVWLYGVSPSGRYILGKPGQGHFGDIVCVDVARDNRWWAVKGVEVPSYDYRFSSSERYVMPWSYWFRDTEMVDLQENRPAWPKEDGWGYSGQFVCFLGHLDRFLMAISSYKYERTMRLEMWDPRAREKSAVGKRDLLRIDNACLSPDGRVLAVADYDGNIHLWSADDYSDLLHIPAGLERTACLRFSSDSNHLVAVEASSQRRRRAVVWRLE